jgi:hypothetical protein
VKMPHCSLTPSGPGLGLGPEDTFPVLGAVFSLSSACLSAAGNHHTCAVCFSTMYRGWVVTYVQCSRQSISSWLAVLTLRKVTDAPLPSEQVPEEEQGIECCGKAGRVPDHDVPKQVDLSLKAHGASVSRPPSAHGEMAMLKKTRGTLQTSAVTHRHILEPLSPTTNWMYPFTRSPVLEKC